MSGLQLAKCKVDVDLPEYRRVQQTLPTLTNRECVASVMKGFIVRPVSYIRTTAVAVADDSIRRMRTVDTTGQTVTSDTIHPTKYKVLLPRYHLSAVCHPPLMKECV